MSRVEGFVWVPLVGLVPVSRLDVVGELVTCDGGDVGLEEPVTLEAEVPTFELGAVKGLLDDGLEDTAACELAASSDAPVPSLFRELLPESDDSPQLATISSNRADGSLLNVTRRLEFMTAACAAAAV